MADDPLGLGKTGETIVKELAELLKPLLRPGTEELGEMFTDRVRFWPFKQMVRLVETTNKFLQDRNIEPRGIPPKLLVPMLNSGSLEDDEYLIEKWAGLLASAAAGDPVHTIYPKILDELEPTDAKILDAMYQRLIETTPEEKNLLTMKDIRERLDLSPEEFEIAMSNITRLGLGEVPAYPTGTNTLHVQINREIPGHVRARLSPIGEGLIKACRGPAPKPSRG
jgi:hypothetical protein